MNFDLTTEQSIWKSRAEVFSRGISSASLLESGIDVVRDSWAVTDLADSARRDWLLEWGSLFHSGGASIDMPTLVLILEALASGESLLGVLVANQYLCHRSCRLLNARTWEKVLGAEYSAAPTGFSAALLWSSSDASSFAPGAATIARPYTRIFFAN